jgi:teichuronic acid biosynthesis glycosyltransferase TuaC
LEGVIRRQLIKLKPDLVHVHGANAFGLAALQATHTLKIPSVLTLHGGDVYDSPFLSKHHLKVFTTAMQIPSRIIAVSLDLAEKASLLANVPVLHLPLGINLQRFSVRTPKNEARDQFRLPRDLRIVLYLGNLLQAKGVQVLLDSLRGYANRELGVFAGKGPLASIIEQHPHARLLGPVCYSDVPALISAADVLVLPSFSEGLGTVLVEAGALGVPAIGSAIGGIPSLLGNDRGYLVPANDPIVLAQVITEVLENPSEANNRANQLKIFIQKNYDSEINSVKLFNIYNEIL